jgi:hypothetical protein
MPGRLPIIDVAAAGIGRALRSLPGLMAIFWLPWLLGTIALLILEVVVQDQLRLGWAPDWLREIVWAPFAAMAYVMLVRWMVNGEAPARPINLDVGRQTWIATPVVALWFVASTAVNGAPLAMLRWLPLSSDTLVHQWEDVAPYFLAFRFVAWLINGALLACLFGLIVVIARSGRLDLGEHWRLLRLQPVRLFCICLLAVAAVGGLDNLGQQVLAWLGAGQLAPSTMIPWRAHVRQAFLAELPNFPVHFLGFAVQGSILVEAYRRLLAQPRMTEPQAAQT